MREAKVRRSFSHRGPLGCRGRLARTIRNPFNLINRGASELYQRVVGQLTGKLIGSSGPLFPGSSAGDSVTARVTGILIDKLPARKLNYPTPASRRKARALRVTLCMAVDPVIAALSMLYN